MSSRSPNGEESGILEPSTKDNGGHKVGLVIIVSVFRAWLEFFFTDVMFSILWLRALILAKWRSSAVHPQVYPGTSPLREIEGKRGVSANIEMNNAMHMLHGPDYQLRK